MTKHRFFLLAPIAVLLLTSGAAAQTFVSGSTGADGPFNPDCTPKPCSVTVDLPANGVFHFTTVSIPAGVEVHFKPNALNTPVFLLATKDVTIQGAIDISSETLCGVAPAAAAGPGGYNGGHGEVQSGSGGGGGLGPGAGGPGAPGIRGGGGGAGFREPGSTNTSGGAAQGGAPGGTYGTEFLIPLVGGSGGGGGSVFGSSTGGAGGGGGGAILIASSGTITIGSIVARGGIDETCIGCDSGGGGGSGGAIRLIANTMRGNPKALNAAGGASVCGKSGGSGRIRLEFFESSLSAPIPTDISAGTPGSVFVPGLPSLSIASVGGIAAPASPRGSYASPDLSLAPTASNPVAIAIKGSNIPLGTTVQVSVIPKLGPPSVVTSTALAGTFEASTATANVTLPIGKGTAVVIMAQASYGTQTAGLAIPPIHGEQVVSARVDASLAGSSILTYVTESGREVAAADVGILFQRKLEGSGIK